MTSKLSPQKGLPWPRKALTEHLRVLARVHKIRMDWNPDDLKAWAMLTPRQVQVPKPTSPWRYLVGLHELGHVICPTARGRDKDYEEAGKLPHTLACEAAAWGWAIENIHPAVWARMDRDVLDEAGRALFTHVDLADALC